MQLSGDLRFTGSSGRQGDQRLVYPLVSLKVAHHPSQVFDRFVTFLDQRARVGAADHALVR